MSRQLHNSRINNKHLTTKPNFLIIMVDQCRIPPYMKTKNYGNGEKVIYEPRKY